MRVPEIDAVVHEAYDCRYTEPERARRLVAGALRDSVATGYEFGRGQTLFVQGALGYHACQGGAIDDALAALEILSRHDRGGGKDGGGTDGYDEARAHALCQNLLAIHHSRWGSYDTMIEHLRVALEIALRIGDRPTQALVATNMAVANERIGGYDEAIRFHDEARNLAREVGDEFRYWTVTAYRAEVLALAGRLDEALPDARLAAESVVLRGTQPGCEAVAGLASLYVRLGRFTEAHGAIECARTLCDQGDYPLVACGIEETAGRLAAAEGRDEDAIALFRTAVAISHRHDNVANRAAALRGIVDACRRRGCHEDALDALNEIVGLKDTLLTDKSAGRARALSVAHRLEWDRREGALVRAQNEELRAANAGLHALLAEKEALHARVLAQATHDELTGVVNRRTVAAEGTREFERHRRGTGPMCVALLDIDRFKTINDTYGHAAGDEVLRRLAAIGERESRICDVFGRWGGEEFLLVLPGVNLEEAREAVERLRRVIAATAFGDLFPAGTITASLGVAEAKGHPGFDALVRTADEAMYRAKREGRDRVESGVPRRLRAPEIARGAHAPAFG